MRKIAVIGVEEGLGREVINLLAEQGCRPQDVFAVAPRSVMGNMISFGEDADLDILSLDKFDFNSVQVAIFATTTELAKKYIPIAQKNGVKIIDASGAMLSNPDIPMILSGFNNDKISDVVSVPSAEVMPLLQALQNIHKQYQITRVVASVYASTNFYGRAGMDELFNQTRKIFMNDTLADDQSVFHKQIAFNVIPHIGDFIGEETSVEWAFNTEVKQVFGGNIKSHANCAIIPAFLGQAQYINIETQKEFDVDEAKSLLQKTKGIVVFDKQTDGGYVTLTDVQGEDNVYISRLRQDSSVENGISLWCVADNLRVSAINIVNIIKLWK
ncbi:MAG: aspartate-semialdehyde dehydrogenase [Alphaproteobacteria bacterium]|nr:aspartate-semialdehyde dehydrogenase [Alphaproteobacteria bacterium]